MEDSVLEVLLEEVKARYKAEHERYGQLYSRIGVYSAVFALYANALIRFSEKPPPCSGGWLCTTWYASTMALVVFTVIGFLFLLLALWGKAIAYSWQPGEWTQRVEPLRTYVEESLASEGNSKATQVEIEDRTALELKRDILKTLADAADINIQRNTERYAWLHWGSRFAAFGFLSLLLSFTLYVGIGWGVPAAPTQVVARIVAPVELAPGTQVRTRIVDPIQLVPPQPDLRPEFKPEPRVHQTERPPSKDAETKR